MLNFYLLLKTPIGLKRVNVDIRNFRLWSFLARGFFPRFGFDCRLIII